MKDINNIIADLQTWVEEDKENRAIALVAVQKTEEDEEKYKSELHALTHGIKRLLVDAFNNVMNAKDCGLDEVLRMVIRRQALTGLANITGRVLKNSGNKPENGSEERKEADYE